MDQVSVQMESLSSEDMTSNKQAGGFRIVRCVVEDGLRLTLQSNLLRGEREVTPDSMVRGGLFKGPRAVLLTKNWTSSTPTSGPALSVPEGTKMTKKASRFCPLCC